MAYFDGQLAIVHRSGGQINVYYDGAFAPDGHGHVKATGGPLGKNTVYYTAAREQGRSGYRRQLMGNHERQRFARSPH